MAAILWTKICFFSFLIEVICRSGGREKCEEWPSSDTLLPRLVPVFRKLPVSSRICRAEASGR